MAGQDYDAGCGTKVFIKGEQVAIILPGSKYDPGPDEVEIHNIGAIDLRIRPNEVVIANIQLLGIFDNSLLIGKPVFYVGDPLSDEVKQVKKIEFSDGTIWEVP